jgi:hypothetical protein
MEDFIIIRIIHGSRRRKLFRQEVHEFFGKFGGHVAIQIRDFVYGFYYADIKNIHIFPKNRNKNCEFQKQTLEEWEEIIKIKKETSVKIPVSKKDIEYLLEFYAKNLKEPSHDYSFIGERCASSVYHLLKRINKMDGGNYVFNAFYPKQFRNKLVKQAAKYGYEVTVKKGTPERIWG